MGQYWLLEGRGWRGRHGRDGGRVRSDNVSSVLLAAQRWCGNAHTHTFALCTHSPFFPTSIPWLHVLQSPPPLPLLLSVTTPYATCLNRPWQGFSHDLTNVHLRHQSLFSRTNTAMTAMNLDTTHIKVCLLALQMVKQKTHQIWFSLTWKKVLFSNKSVIFNTAVGYSSLTDM